MFQALTKILDLAARPTYSDSPKLCASNGISLAETYVFVGWSRLNDRSRPLQT